MNVHGPLRKSELAKGRLGKTYEAVALGRHRGLNNRAACHAQLKQFGTWLSSVVLSPLNFMGSEVTEFSLNPKPEILVSIFFSIVPI